MADRRSMQQHECDRLIADGEQVNKDLQSQATGQPFKGSTLITEDALINKLINGTQQHCAEGRMQCRHMIA